MSGNLGSNDLGELRARFEERLMAWLPVAGGITPVLHEAMRYACTDGKRVRPLMCTGAALACGGCEEAALAPSVALELVHCYSLVHDDLPAMDDDTMRRGRPTLHVKFGEAQAILAGDALLAKAFEALTDPSLGPLPAAAAIALVRELAVAAGSSGMAGGQADELAACDEEAASGPEGHESGRQASDLARARRIASLKTGALLRSSARMGAIVAAASAGQEIAGGEKLLCAMTGFGEQFGLAYQVVDDLGDELKDKALGRNLNFAITLGRRAAADMARELCGRAASSIDAAGCPGTTAVLHHLVDLLRAGIPCDS